LSGWHLYLIRTGQGSLYTGIATDVERRLTEHRDGSGAKYLRSRRPLILVYRVAVGDRSMALRLEGAIKRLRKVRKEAIVAASPTAAELAKMLGIGDAE
jgi:putative endonuclease